MSDLHGYLPEDIEPCDVVCICGDIFPLQIQHYTKSCKKWLEEEFSKWVESLPCKKVILIAGNHDFFFERHPEWGDIINSVGGKLRYLSDSSYEFEGKIFYGTPWCPDLINWAFYASSMELENKFSKIPENVDVLLTHCPPRLLGLGEVLQKDSWNFGRNFGCYELADAIREKKPKYAFSGHVHSGNHDVIKDIDVTYANVSIKDENYEVTYKPFIINI